MAIPLVRISKIALRRKKRGPLGLLDESVVRFRVWPNDIDVNLHLNNGRYLTIMDLGRFDLVGRNGMFEVALANRWTPLVGTAILHYFRPIQPFASYDLRTRLVCWDDKWFWVNHRFELEGQLMATGAIRGLFRGRDGNVPPRRLLEMSGLPVDSPPPPDWVERWKAADSSWTAAMKEVAG